MEIGVAYYPEHWPEDRWALDARLMVEAGIEVVRVGEFAWSRLEPRRERIETDWLEAALAVLAEHGLKVILCTPTAAPPPWLFQRHPDLLPQDRDGRRWYSGSRRDVCLNSPAYRRYARRIVTELAKRFGSGHGVRAWQVDNELGGHGSGVCYCEDCQQAFRQWLKRRYGTIERLNTKWGTSFWSQGFSDWHEIPAPRRTPAGIHPSLALDYSRFVSATYRSFVAEQGEIIRQFADKSVIVTTNSPGPARLQHINHFSMAAVEDVAALSNYPLDSSRLERTAFQQDLMRSVRNGPFWVLEQQAGAGLIEGHSCQPRPGQLRLWAYQAAARGAALIAFFRWRTCPFGQEMHWYGMLDADGTPRRRFKELKETIADLKSQCHLWEGRRPGARVAVMLDYDSAWALAATRMGLEIDYFAHLQMLCKLLRRMGAAVQFVQPGGDLSGFSVVVDPMPFMSTDERADHLQVYAAGGGRVMITAPAGYRTVENTTPSAPVPGSLGAVLGIEVPEHDILLPGAANSIALEGEEKPFATGRFCSLLELRGARAIGAYEQQFYAGSPAITVSEVGRGEILFVGALCEEECYRVLLKRMLRDAGVELSQWCSETLEVIPLEAGDDSPPLRFVLNHADTPVTLPLPEGVSCKDVLTDRDCGSALELGGYEVVLLSM